MAALTPSAISYGRELDGCRLTQIYVNAITDLDTVATGIGGIVKVMNRGSTASTTTALTLSNSALSSGVGNTRRTQAYLTNVATGEVTFEATSASALNVVMIWHRG